MSAQPAVALASDSKPCPMCGEPVLKVAKKCKHCGSMLDGSGDAGAQAVKIVGADPFADMHTPIAGKKKGKVTVIGYLGIGLGVLFIIAGFASMTSRNSGDGFMFALFGAGISVASFLWVRR